MKYLLTLFYLVIPFLITAQDIDYSASTLPEKLKENAGSVIRYRKVDYHVHSFNEATMTEHKVVTILNDDHNQENQMVLLYDDNTKVTNFKATLYDASGEKIRSAKKSEIEDILYIHSGQFYVDTRLMTTTLDHLSYPYTVEFEYEKKVKDYSMVAGFPVWRPVGFRQSVQFSSFTAYVPANNEFLYHAGKLPDPVVGNNGTDKTYRWAINDHFAVLPEAQSPSMSKTMPFLKTGLKKFAIDDYEGSYSSWQSFGAFINKLMAGRDVLPAPLAALVNEATAGLGTDLERIDALYHLLQGNTRYVGVQLGIGGWQPFSAEYVYNNRYGDCKALSNYMGAMLKEVGIESYPVLVNSSDTPFFEVEEDFPTSAFNHMILYVPSEDMYLECTSSTSPTGYMGEGTDDRNVLHITPEGGKLARTPKIKAADNGRLRTLNLEIKTDGSTSFALHNRMYGSFQDGIRGFTHGEQDLTKQQEVLNRNDFLPDVGGEYLLECDENSPVATLVYRTTLPGYARKLGKRTFVPVNKYAAYEYVPEKLKERKFAIYDNDASFRVDTINLTFPDGMEVESMGEELTEFKHAAGEYRAELKSTPGKITWIRTLKLLPVDLPATAYEDYRQFFVDVRKAEKRQVVLKEKRTK